MLHQYVNNIYVFSCESIVNACYKEDEFCV